MADENKKSYMQLQMEELKTMHGIEVEIGERDTGSKSGRPEDAEIAQLYEDAAEYEAELECFEAELELIKTGTLKEMAASLSQRFPEEEKNYAQELKAVVENGWKHLTEVDRTHPEAQSALIRETAFEDIADKLSEAYPDYTGNFEEELKRILVKSWELHIEIKKEHIKEEITYIKTLGLKPHYAKKVYKRYHGIE